MPAARSAGFVWKDNGIWQSERFCGDTSVQILELRAVVAVLNRWNIQDLNIVTDSLYVAGVVQGIERALLGHVNNPTLSQAFVNLRNTDNHRMHRVFIMHIKSHTRLPGGLVEGNAQADQLVAV